MEVKVSDVVPSLKESTVSAIKESIGRLKSISNEYTNMQDLQDPFVLEKIKRDFDSELTNMATLFSKIKRYKGGQHVYLEDTRKRIKSEIISKLMSPPLNLKTTQAETAIYSNEEYVAKMEIIENLRGFMTNVELLYDRYESTFNSIIQSQSLAKYQYEKNR